MKTLLVILGAALGATARYYLSLWLSGLDKNISISVLFANIAASFIAGATIIFILEKALSEPYRLFLLIGFAGSFSTMSAVSLEMAQMLELGSYIRAGLYGFFNIIFSLFATLSGMMLARYYLTYFQ